MKSAGFEEIEHTADWAMRVWAPDLAGLFEYAARGMYALAGIQGKGVPREQIILTLEGEDIEDLLVGFLSELLYWLYVKGLVFDTFHIEVQDGELKARLTGSPVASYGKEIKAVTYHDLRVKSTPHGYETVIVFDV